MKKEKILIRHRLILKVILNFWTLFTILLFGIDFFSGNKIDTSASAIGIIYMAILGIYASEKEYSRWKTRFNSHFFGESFIVIWTIAMVIFVVCAFISPGSYKIPTEFSIVYTSVIGVFAITQHSKTLRQTE